jgi:hypothetical protein
VNELPSDALSLQAAFNEYLASLNDEIWRNQDIVKFLDNCREQSAIANIQIGLLTREVTLSFFQRDIARW